MHRINWVDYAKGICIILVVMMHSTLGVEKAVNTASFIHPFIEWAKPFRMPDFFLISGLFLASRIDKPWRAYLDTKFVHFAYFYLLWMSIQLLTKSGGLLLQGDIGAISLAFLMALVEPFGTLWFIYILAVFFIVVKLTQRAPAIAVFAIGAILEIATINTGWLLVDEFAARFVFFFTGYWMAKHVFQFAAWVNSKASTMILAGLVTWGFGNHLLVSGGYASLPVVSLVLGFVGAGAVISSGVLLSKFKIADGVRYCGENSIVIYLAFFLFMAGSRTALLRFAPQLDIGMVALLVTMVGVIGPLLLFWLTRNTGLSFLFRRPAWAKLRPLPNGAFGWHSRDHVKQLNIKPQPEIR
ncbi:MAG: acyltransferase family protein [Alphaproteobacteria bacterium]|nr:acyltransferase family protein [Alphaproteobacteria bacterium]